MGEKEIKPADPKPQDPTPPPYGGTQEKPGTGDPNAKQGEPSNQGGGDKGSGKGGGGGSSGGYTASTTFNDGYTMGIDEDGHTFLQNPDGSRGTFDYDNQTWKGEDGKSMGSGWSGGHAPADYGPRR